MSSDVWCSSEHGLWQYWRCCWVNSSFFRGRREGRFAASRRLLMVCLDSRPITPWRSSLTCRAGLKRCLLQCCTISLSSFSFVALGWSLLGKFLRFPVCLFLATSRLIPTSVIPKRTPTAEKDCPVAATPTICLFISSLFLRPAMSDLSRKQQ